MGDFVRTAVCQISIPIAHMVSGGLLTIPNDLGNEDYQLYDRQHVHHPRDTPLEPTISTLPPPCLPWVYISDERVLYLVG